MANGIDPRYTGIPIVPEVIEEKTSAWDAIESLYGMVKQEEIRADKKKLDWGKLNAQIEANQDLKDYRSESIDLQNREADNLKAYRRKQGEIAGQNANTAAATQKSNAQFQKDTTFINRIKLLPEGERLREILLYGAENPGYMKRSGTSTEKINERIKDLEDYKMDMTRASGFYKSNNPLQIKYHMKKLIDGDISTNEAARDIYAALGTQLGTAEKFQKELYEATPKEIAEMYPEYAENLKSIAQKFMPQLDLAKMSGDEAFKAMSAQKKAIPVGQMEAYNAQVRIITDSYANKYRMAKGIGVYDTATQFPTETEAQAEFEIAPDDYTLTDERYKLIEKAQDENNPLWEKWLNEEDYTFEDLKTDYEAGLKADSAPPVTPPVTPPVDPPVTPPVEPPVTPPVTPPVEPPVTPPEEEAAMWDDELGWVTSTLGRPSKGQIEAARAQGIGPKKTEIKISAKKGNLEKYKNSLVNAQKSLEGVKRAGNKKQITYWQGQVDKYKKKISDIEAM